MSEVSLPQANVSLGRTRQHREPSSLAPVRPVPLWLGASRSGRGRTWELIWVVPSELDESIKASACLQPGEGAFFQHAAQLVGELLRVR